MVKRNTKVMVDNNKVTIDNNNINITTYEKDIIELIDNYITVDNINKININIKKINKIFNILKLMPVKSCVFSRIINKFHNCFELWNYKYKGKNTKDIYIATRIVMKGFDKVLNSRNYNSIHLQKNINNKMTKLYENILNFVLDANILSIKEIVGEKKPSINFFCVKIHSSPRNTLKFIKDFNILFKDCVINDDIKFVKEVVSSMESWRFKKIICNFDQIELIKTLYVFTTLSGNSKIYKNVLIIMEYLFDHLDDNEYTTVYNSIKYSSCIMRHLKIYTRPTTT